MAVSESIDSVLKALNETIVEADALMLTVAAVNEENPPPWVFTVQCMLDRISAANEELQTIVIQKALPRLRDFDRVSVNRS
jgi:hypothetical protein